MMKYLDRHDISEEDRQKKDAIIAIYNLMFAELDELIQTRIVSMLKANPKRVDYYERYQWYVREGFTSDEELSLYDMLFDENLSKKDIKKIKKVAVELLDKIKSKISELDHWTDKQETRAEVEVLIRDI